MACGGLGVFGPGRVGRVWVWLRCGRGWFASGELLRGAVLVELEDVAGELDERPFAASGAEAAAAETADRAVVFAVTEDGFDQAGALSVGVGALRGTD